MIALPLDHDHELSLGPGERLRLEDVPSSGFSWEMSELPEGWSVSLDEWGPSTVDDTDEDELISAGVRVLAFAATPDAREGQLTLRRRRTWESEPPKATVTVTLTPVP